MMCAMSASQDRYIFPDRAYAPGYEPSARPAEESPPDPIMTGADYLRFGTMLCLMGGGLAVVSVLLLG